jgi:hypothetical protein
MYDLIYILVVICVICLLLTLPLYPFWKVRARLKSHHPDLWAGKGPFDMMTMMAHGSAVRAVWDIIKDAENDAALQKRDPELTKWAGLAREVARLLPRSFLGQLGYVLVFMYFVWFLTSLIMSILKA